MNTEMKSPRWTLLQKRPRGEVKAECYKSILIKYSKLRGDMTTPYSVIELVMGIIFPAMGEYSPIHRMRYTRQYTAGGIVGHAERSQREEDILR